MLKHIFSVFCKPPLIHRIVCPRRGPGKCFSHDLGQFLNPYWTATKMLTISQECFLSFFGCPVPFPLYSLLCAHCLAHLSWLFFPLPHILFNFYFPVFLFPTSCFILCPSWIHLIICQHHGISADFLSAMEMGNFLESFYKLSLQPVACIYTLLIPLTFSAGTLE